LLHEDAVVTGSNPNMLLAGLKAKRTQILFGK
jgi:hypothetical protein